MQSREARMGPAYHHATWAKMKDWGSLTPTPPSFLEIAIRRYTAKEQMGFETTEEIGPACSHFCKENKPSARSTGKQQQPKLTEGTFVLPSSGPPAFD